MIGVLAVLAAVLLGVSAGGGAENAVVTQRAAPAERPSALPPLIGGRNAPPPAWVETERGSFWLTYSGYCWAIRCVKEGGVMLDSAVPRIVVRRGEVVRFHLGFQPRHVTLAVGPARSIRPEPARTLSWRVDRGGVVSLLAYSARGEAPAGSVGYVARFAIG
jgi:hypothetical protein